MQTAFVALDTIHDPHELPGPHPGFPEGVVVVADCVDGLRGVVMKLCRCSPDARIVQKGVVQNGGEIGCCILVYLARCAVLSEPLPGTSHGGEHEHVCEVQVLNSLGVLPVRA